MIYDVKKNYFIHYYMDNTTIIWKYWLIKISLSDLSIIERISNNINIEWIFSGEDKIKFLFKDGEITNEDDMRYSHFLRNTRYKGLIKYDKCGNSISRLNIETLKSVPLRGWAKKKFFSRCGEFILYGDIIQDNNRKQLDYFDKRPIKFNVIDVKRYLSHLIISDSIGLFYYDKYVDKKIDYNFGIVNHYLIWYNKEENKYYKYDLRIIPFIKDYIDINFYYR